MRLVVSNDKEIFLNHSFQFQCGAIGSILPNNSGGVVRCFNSSVVRLVELDQTTGRSQRNVFQFQCGAIGSFDLLAGVLASVVSIPVWCDW